MRIECDVAVVGAGVAGLWAWRRLRALGFDALLVSAGPAGAGQTIASQGIIHGGIKYALGGEATRASEMIAAMPGVWAACLAGNPGRGDPDLSGVRVLADHQRLWTTRGVVSRIGGLAASAALRTGVTREAADARPAAFEGAGRDIDVYRVEEPVIEARSLVSALLEGEGPSVEGGAEFVDGAAPRDDAGLFRLRVGTGEADAASVSARAVVCAAGAGNEFLLRQRGVDAAGCAQRRPLHMVMARGDMPLVYGHCVTASALPRATITSQRDSTGRVVWYVGGAIAERGVEFGREEQIDRAKRELAEVIPWVSLAGAEWATLRVDRAEGLPAGAAPGKRPDAPVVRRMGGAVFAWPTKLAFAPLMAQMVEREVMGLLGGGAAGRSGARAMGGSAMGARAAGPLPWEDPGVAWT